MVRRSYGWGVSAILAAAVLACACAPVASARDDSVTSFDGTDIVLSFFPAEGLQPGQKAPTILIGPGWSSGRDTDENSASSDCSATPAWARSGRPATTCSPGTPADSASPAALSRSTLPQYEGRDVQALISYVARQPEAKLDSTGDPRVGMSGASYGGGIQLVTAALDSRLDAIAPDIAWHSLVTSLYKAQSPKAGWGSALFALGVEGSDDPGHPRRADRQPRPAHHQRVHVGACLRPVLGRGPAVVRVARSRRAGRPDPDPDAADPGNRRHAVHAGRGEHQLPDPARQPRAREDHLVLRWPRRMSHEPRSAGVGRAADHPVVRALAAAQERVDRPALRVDRRRRPGAQRSRVPAGRCSRYRPRRGAGCCR